jgi:hypothetical protein
VRPRGTSTIRGPVQALRQRRTSRSCRTHQRRCRSFSASPCFGAFRAHGGRAVGVLAKGAPLLPLQLAAMIGLQRVTKDLRRLLAHLLELVTDTKRRTWWGSGLFAASRRPLSSGLPTTQVGLPRGRVAGASRIFPPLLPGARPFGDVREGILRPGCRDPKGCGGTLPGAVRVGAAHRALLPQRGRDRERPGRGHEYYTAGHGSWTSWGHRRPGAAEDSCGARPNTSREASPGRRRTNPRSRTFRLGVGRGRPVIPRPNWVRVAWFENAAARAAGPVTSPTIPKEELDACAASIRPAFRSPQRAYWHLGSNFVPSAGEHGPRPTAEREPPLRQSEPPQGRPDTDNRPSNRSGRTRHLLRAAPTHRVVAPGINPVSERGALPLAVRSSCEMVVLVQAKERGDAAVRRG